MASLLPLAVMAIAAGSAFAQGDPEALSGTMLNNPTKSWMQWQPKPTYAIDDLPDQYMGANRIPGYSEPQTGFNNCADEGWNQKSQCQTAWLNDVNDWCIWGPPDGGEVGATERIAVAYCTTDTHGTRLIPDGTITGAHFVRAARLHGILPIIDRCLPCVHHFPFLFLPYSCSSRHQAMSRSLVWATSPTSASLQVTPAVRWTRTVLMISAIQSVASSSPQQTPPAMASLGKRANGQTL